MRATTFIAIGLLAWACGGDESRTRGDARTEAVLLRASANGRTVVADVGGVPVYDDCVEAQAAEHNLTAEAALEQCIAFELLAAEAERAGLATEAEVREVGRRESVRQFLLGDFYKTWSGPESLPAIDLQPMWKNLPLKAVRERYFDHPELRESVYCRVGIERPPPRSLPPATPPERQPSAALAAATDLLILAVHGHVTALAAQGELDDATFLAACREVAAGVTKGSVRVEAVEFAPHSKKSVEEGFGAALFGLGAVGDTTPPIASKSGWFIIRLVSVLPERHDSFEQALPELRKLVWNGEVTWVREVEAYRRSIFGRWYRPYGNAHHIEVYPENLPVDELLVQGGAVK